jgi:hypothetical protein
MTLGPYNLEIRFNSIGPFMSKFKDKAGLTLGDVCKFLDKNPEELKNFSPNLASFFLEIENISKSIIDGCNARMKLYPALENVNFDLAKKGWFISKFFGLSEIDRLSEIAMLGNIEKLESLIERFYREDILDHSKLIISEYPKHEFMLRPAVDAHLRGDFGISIPIFFIITDGICVERVKKYIFQGRENVNISILAKEKIYNSELSNNDELTHNMFDIIARVMWGAISEKLPISYNESARGKYHYDGLNRHKFIHGIADEKEATEKNSLKAFSLLSSIASLLPENK